jgi:hypothetical protein
MAGFGIVSKYKDTKFEREYREAVVPSVTPAACLSS